MCIATQVFQCMVLVLLCCYLFLNIFFSSLFCCNTGAGMGNGVSGLLYHAADDGIMQHVSQATC